MSGLEYEAVGMKFVSPGFSMDAGPLVNDGKTPRNPTVRGLPTTNYNEDNVERGSAMKRLLPPWASAGPGMAVVDRRPG